ncbi:MAG: DUF3276 family protein [Treponema sp.]|nr:DUF3276 family protein [Treponema sp.]
MGIRGELYTTQVTLANRSYFFNVKENRTGDVFLQIVESKNREGVDSDRHQIAVFEEDMQKFFSGLDDSLKFIQKNKKEREKARAERKAAKEAKYGPAAASGKKIYKKKAENPDARPVDPNAPKRTGRVHVVSKREK